MGMFDDLRGPIDGVECGHCGEFDCDCDLFEDGRDDDDDDDDDDD